MWDKITVLRKYHATKKMKKFLDKITDCKTKEDQQMLDQVKHYLDWPLQLYALQEAEFQLVSVKKLFRRERTGAGN